MLSFVALTALCRYLYPQIAEQNIGLAFKSFFSIVRKSTPYERMKPLPILFLSLALATLFLTSCADPNTPNPRQTAPLKAAHVNPFAPGTYVHFRAQKGYPRNYGIWRNEEVLARTNGSNAKIRIDLSAQRAYLMNGHDLAMDYPISSGTSAHPTPTGNFQVLEKLPSAKRSNTYGKIYDAEDNVVKRNADARKDEIPEGGKFVGASMPYWMRISWDGIGMHRGRVPRYPASHGCVRTYSKAVSTVYSKVKIGTPVTIVR